MKCIFSISLFIISLQACCQNNGSNLLLIFSQADSVIIVSHQSLIKPRAAGQTEKRLELIKENKLNYAIMPEIKKLDKPSIDNLTEILLTPNNDTDISSVSCFEPHHAIFIYTKDSISYLDLCFTCHTFKTSADIIIAEPVFSMEIWARLKSLFKEKQLTFKLPL